MSSMMIKPVDKNNWSDFEAFFQPRLNYCWCMAWRMIKEELKHNNAICRKEFMKERVWSGIPVGLLGYVDNEPMAWCSVAPREPYRRLYGAEELEKVWSIACFYIKNEFRGRESARN